MTDTRTTAGAPSRASYAENFRVLHEVAERLRTAGAEDVDDLVADFRRAMDAYRVCQDRLDAIRSEIDAEVDWVKPLNV